MHKISPARRLINWIVIRPLLIGFLAFFLLAGLSGFILFQHYGVRKGEFYMDAHAVAETAKHDIQLSLDQCFSAALTASFSVNQDGNITDFDSVAAAIIKYNNKIYAIELLPGGVIQKVYPSGGKEQILGYDLLGDSTKNKKAIRSRETGRMYFGGPFRLLEGGEAVIGLRPVYRKNNFWGFTAVVIRLDDLLKMSGIDSAGNKKFYCQLSRVNAVTKKEIVFYKGMDKQPTAPLITASVPDTEWLVSVFPVDSFALLSEYLFWIIFTLLISVTGAVLLTKLIKRPSDLEKLVVQRTKELDTSVRRNNAIVNAIPDLIFILDGEGRFLDYNNSQDHYMYVTPDEFLGKKVTSVLPGNIGTEALENIKQALSGKKIITHAYQLSDGNLQRDFEARYVASDKNEVYVIIRDITENKKTQDALKESEKRFRSIFDSSFQFTGLLTPDGKIVEVNQTLARYLGIPQEEMVGKYMWEISFWDNKKEEEERIAWLKDAINKAREGEIVRQEIRAAMKNGVMDMVDLSIKPLKDDDGNVIYLIPEGRVTTSLREAEAELNKAHQQLTRHLDNSPLAVLEYTNALQITQWSKRAEEIFGWTKEEVLGKNLAMLNLVYKDDIPAITAIGMQLLTEEIGGNISYNRNCTKDGKVLHCVWYNSVIRNRHGKIISIMSQVQDITHEKETEEALKQSEQKYRTLVDQASDAIIVYNPDGRVVEFNESALKYTGYLKEEIANRMITDFLFKEDLVEKPLRFEDLKKGIAVTDQRRIKRKNGAAFYVELNSKILPNGNVMAIARDITERKISEEKLKASEQKLRQVLSSTADNFYVIDKDYNVILINEVAEKNLKIAWNKKVETGTNILEVIPAGSDEPILASFQKVLAGQNLEYELRTHDTNLPEWILVNFSPVYDESGTVSGAAVIAKDITERKKAEIGLLESKDRLEKAEEQANLGSWEFDIQTQKGYWSKQMLRMFGLDVNGGAPGFEEYLQLIHPDDRNMIADVLNNFVKGEGPVHSVFRTNPEKLPLRYFTPSWNCIYDEEGRPLKFSGTTVDITERIKAENEIRISQNRLAESEARLKSIIEQAPDAVYLAELDGSIVMVNPVATEQLGFTEAEFLGMNVTSIDPLFPDNNKLSDYWEKLDLNVPVMLETHHRRKDGSLIPVEVKTSRINIGGKNFMIGFVRDVTVRKEAETKLINSELRFRTLTENAPVGIFQTDLEGKTIYVNDTLLSYVKMNYDDTMGYGWSAAIHPEDKDIAFKNWMERSAKREESVAEYRMLQPDGNILWVSGRAIPLYDNDGNYNGYLGTVIDITFRKKTEEEIVKIKERYELIALATNDALWETDYLTGETWWNYRHYQFYGHNPDLPPLSNHEWEIRIHPDQKQFVIESFNKCLTEKGTIWEEEYLFLLPGPGKKYAYVNDKAFFYYKEGELVKIIGSMTDITEKRASEERLKESETKYRYLFTNSPLPMWVCERDSCRFLDVNEAAVKHYGYSKNEFLSMCFWDIRSGDDNTGNNRVQLKKKFRDIFRHQKKDGTIIDVEVSGHEINFNNNPARLMVAVDITDKLAYEQEIKLNSQRLRELTDHLHNVREEERKNIAREIHDELGQQLTVLKIDVSSLLKKTYDSEKERQAKIKGVLSLVDETVKTVRKISSELRPSMLDDLGLIAALEWHSQEFEKRSGIRIYFISDIPEIKLPSKLMNGLFRIYQESLTNIARHADATEIKSIVSLKNNLIELIVKDNGRGFVFSSVKNKKTLGILGMQERVSMLGGSFNIYSSLGEGTLVEVVLPLTDSSE